MGLSTLRRAQEFERLVSQGDAHRNGTHDADLASHLLATKQASNAKWGRYTCARYLIIATRFAKASSSNHGQVGDEVWAICIVIQFGQDAQCHHSSSDMRGDDCVGFNTLLGAGLQDPDQLGAAFQGFCGRLHSFFFSGACCYAICLFTSMSARSFPS